MNPAGTHEEIPPQAAFQLGKSRGFTLVEMLVSIAIIGIIAALLMAGMGKMSERGQGAKCLANLKSISLGVHGYLSDNNGVFPSAQTAEPEVLWFHVIQPYVDGTSRPAQSTDQPGWLNCPGKKFPTAFRTHVGYGWNYKGFGDEVTDPNGKMRLLSIDAPASTILVGDSPDLSAVGDSWWMNVYIYDAASLLAKRHGGFGNYLFVDGHVESLAPSQLAERLPAVYLPQKEAAGN